MMELFPDGVRTITSFSRGTGKMGMLWKNILNSFKKILIIGYPNSGKTTLFLKLSKIDTNSDRYYYHTDDYKKYEYKEQLYILMDELKGVENWIVEGIQGYRLLRKYAELEDPEYRPDLIIICESETRTPDPKHDRMCKGLDKIWEDYNDLEKNLPDIVYYIN